jgi:uncharacterized protein YbjT (DUF2867 family)
MKVVVTTATGQIGGALTNLLLDAGAEVILPVRHPEKAARFAARGARIMQGSQDDTGFVTEALRGAQAIFWLTPPDYLAQDFRAHQNHYGQVAAAAVRANSGVRVVNLSSVGAHVGEGVGQVSGAGDVEKILNKAAANVTHLRPAYFMENFLWQLEAIAAKGGIFMPMKPSTRIPMIATRDIARAAADRLLDAGWSGQSALELLGPGDLSFAEAAANISSGLGRPVSYIQIPEDAVRQMMLGSGRAGSSFVELLLQMYRALDSGLMSPSRPRTAANSTPTTMLAFAREVMAPMLAAKRESAGT